MSPEGHKKVRKALRNILILYLHTSFYFCSSRSDSSNYIEINTSEWKKEGRVEKRLITGVLGNLRRRVAHRSKPANYAEYFSGNMSYAFAVIQRCDKKIWEQWWVHTCVTGGRFSWDIAILRSLLKQVKYRFDSTMRKCKVLGVSAKGVIDNIIRIHRK